MSNINTGTSLSEESPSVQIHLNIIQGVISRMASNSASSKGWCIAIVSAILVIVSDKSDPNYSYLAFFPTILFCLLDAYYLGLEKGFCKSYKTFVKKVHNNILTPEDLFVVKPEGSLFKLFFKSLASFSVWPFYTTLLFMIFIAKNMVLKWATWQF